MLRAISIHDLPPVARHLEMVSSAYITSGRGEGQWVPVLGFVQTDFGMVFATVILDGKAIRVRAEDLRA